MNKVVEVDFFPRDSGDALSQENATPHAFEAKEKRRILIVDNDPNSTRLVKVLLERSGPYLVLEENDATKAYQSARSSKPDFILLDIVMPETGGGKAVIEPAARAIKGVGDPGHAVQPVVQISGVGAVGKGGRGEIVGVTVLVIRVGGKCRVAALDLPELIAVGVRDIPIRLDLMLSVIRDRVTAGHAVLVKGVGRVARVCLIQID